MSRMVRCPSCEKTKVIKNNRQNFFNCCGLRQSIKDNTIAETARYGKSVKVSEEEELKEEDIT